MNAVRSLRSRATCLSPGGRVTVSVLFLGPLRDLAGEDSRDLPSPLDWSGLCAALPPELVTAISENRVNVACGGQVLADKTALQAQSGDEVALLPPVSGG